MVENASNIDNAFFPPDESELPLPESPVTDAKAVDRMEGSLCDVDDVDDDDDDDDGNGDDNID